MISKRSNYSPIWEVSRSLTHALQERTMLRVFGSERWSTHWEVTTHCDNPLRSELFHRCVVAKNVVIAWHRGTIKSPHHRPFDRVTELSGNGGTHGLRCWSVRLGLQQDLCSCFIWEELTSERILQLFAFSWPSQTIQQMCTCITMGFIGTAGWVKLISWLRSCTHYDLFSFKSIPRILAIRDSAVEKLCPQTMNWQGFRLVLNNYVSSLIATRKSISSDVGSGKEVIIEIWRSFLSWWAYSERILAWHHKKVWL